VSGGTAVDLVLVSVDGPVATVTFNRPDKLNALTLPMLERLERVLGDVEDDETIRVLIVTGAGERAFCAADIDAWSKLEPLDMWRRWTRTGRRVMDRLAALRQPTIASLNGVAFGGGLELALACDLRVAADHVQLAAPEVGVATVPAWGMTARLPAVIGPARAKEMILTASRIPAATAETWGLVNRVVPPADLATATTELARSIAAQAPVSVQVAKELIDAGRGGPAEPLGSGLTAFTGDASEGVTAFRERRPPAFDGS
jgi:enoyl-CoA hydratase/carnithine racemase